MNFIQLLVSNNLSEAKEIIFKKLDKLVEDSLAKIHIDITEASNPNIIKMGRIQKVRRRIRRNKQGRIVVQKNARRSGIKGYRISGSTVRRIPAAVKIRKARLLKRSWKTTRKAKLRRTLMRRKMSMRRRASLGLK